MMSWQMEHGGFHSPSPALSDACFRWATTPEAMLSRSRYECGSRGERDFLGATTNGRARNWNRCSLQEITTWSLMHCGICTISLLVRLFYYILCSGIECHYFFFSTYIRLDNMFLSDYLWSGSDAEHGISSGYSSITTWCVFSETASVAENGMFIQILFVS